MSLSSKILLGLALGLVSGVVFGERMAALEVVGQIFLGLLQMTVLPYIIVALISSIGSLSTTRALQLSRYGFISLGILWALTLILIAEAAISFPNWASGSYFSPELLSSNNSVSFLDQILPKNVFSSLSSGAVPAVVVFSALFGIALMRLDGEPKQRFLLNINVIQRTIGGISGMVMQLAPIGVFAIAANAAGTLDVQDVIGLYVYVVVLGLVCGLLALWIFPYLVKTLTPIKYREVLNVSKTALVTALATGNLFIVLPFIVERVRKLFLEDGEEESTGAAVVEVIVPIAYALPIAGKLIAILFVLFAAWFGGERIGVLSYPELFILGLLKLFGSSYVAVQDLMDMHSVPKELFGLYLVAENIFGNRFGAMVSVMFIVALSILTASGVTGRLRFDFRLLAKLTGICVISVLVMSYILKSMFSYIGYDYQGYSEFIERDLLFTPASSRVLKSLPATLPVEPAGGVLDRIRARKKLRVGYYRDWLPYAFHNKEGKLVGYDVELAHMLARDLGVAVEFVRVYRKDVKRLLASGYLDLATGVALSSSALTEYTLSPSHIQENLALLLPKANRSKAQTWDGVSDLGNAEIGVLSTYYLTNVLQEAIPRSEVTEISSPRDFLRGDAPELDAVIFGAAGASAWTLLYPNYGVVVPQPALPAIPMALPIPGSDTKYIVYINQWFELRGVDGTLNQLKEYWINGKKFEEKQGTRWNLWDHLKQAQDATEVESE